MPQRSHSEADGGHGEARMANHPSAWRLWAAVSCCESLWAAVSCCESLWAAGKRVEAIPTYY